MKRFILKGWSMHFKHREHVITLVGCLPPTPAIQGHHILNLFAAMHVCAVLEAQNGGLVKWSLNN
jgi:hypothetical protein